MIIFMELHVGEYHKQWFIEVLQCLQHKEGMFSIYITKNAVNIHQEFPMLRKNGPDILISNWEMDTSDPFSFKEEKDKTPVIVKSLVVIIKEMKKFYVNPKYYKRGQEVNTFFLVNQMPEKVFREKCPECNKKPLFGFEIVNKSYIFLEEDDRWYWEQEILCKDCKQRFWQYEFGEGWKGESA